MNSLAQLLKDRDALAARADIEAWSARINTLPPAPTPKPAPLEPRFVSQDELDGRRYWADKEWKTYAVDITAGPQRKPTHRSTQYVSSRDVASAVATVKGRAYMGIPSGARFFARLAGPRELGCVSAEELEQMRRDAKVRAAGLDLLAALGAIASDAEGQHADPMRVLQHIAGQARAAIAKATGAAA
jgi:hypothetical protein